jgi:hypothetical protein
VEHTLDEVMPSGRGLRSKRSSLPERSRVGSP